MRIFIGIEIDDGARTAIMSAARALRTRVERPEWHLAARWVRVENLHITLWFIGDVHETRAAAVLTAVAPAFDVPAFTVELNGVGVFPPSGAPRVFWMGVQTGLESLSALHAETALRLVPLGFEPERRAYSAHLTLARITSVSREGYAQLRRVVRETHTTRIRTAVTAVTVFESRVSSKGAAYAPRLRVPLK